MKEQMDKIEQQIHEFTEQIYKTAYNKGYEDRSSNLQEMYEKGYKEGAVKELRKIQEELHKLAFDDDKEYIGVIDNDDAMDLIDNSISKLEGGTNDSNR